MPRSRRCLPVLFTAFAIPAASLAQATTVYRVESFTTDNGLPSQSVADIAQTSDGFLWIATGGMLARFDGSEFRTYTHTELPGLTHRVEFLHAGIGDTLWIADETHAVFALAKGRLTRVVPPSALMFGWIAQDGRGDLFAGTASQVWRLHRDGTSHVMVEPRIPPTQNGWWGPVARDRAGRLWMIDSAFILRQISGPPPAVVPSRAPVAAPLLQVSRRTGEAMVLRAAGSGVQVVTIDGRVVAHFPGSKHSAVRLFEEDGRLWDIYREEYDVFDVGEATPAARLTARWPGTAGRTLLDAGSGCIWLTEVGLFRMCRAPFHATVASSAGRNFLARGPGGSVLAWDSQYRVVAVSGNGNLTPLAPGRPDLMAATAYTDHDGRVWWSGRPISVKARDASDSRLMLPHGDAYAFAELPRDSSALWYASGTNVFRVTLPRSGVSKVTDSVAVAGVVGAMSVSADGALWLAIRSGKTNSAQLARYAHGTMQQFTAADGLPSGDIRAVRADDDGTIWIGSYGGGLIRYRDGKFRAVTEANGLAENVVTSLLDDGHGNLWMGGNRSVHRVAMADVSQFLDGTMRRVRGVAYGREDGLPSPETSGFPGVRDDSLRLWFPTIAGAAMVDPAATLILDSVPPRVHLMAAYAGGDTIEEPRSALRFKRGARQLVVRYSAVSSRRGEAVRFEYRLDDVDADWVDAGRAREARYADVRPGTHTFRVRAISAGGVMSRDDAVVTVTIPPYFHETAWFYALLVAAAIGAGALLLRYREAHLRRGAATLSLAVTERTAKLSEALTTVARQADQLRVLDEAKSRFIANISHEFRTPLSLIVGPVDDLRDGRSGPLPPVAIQRLGGIRSNADRLLQLVEQLLDVARLESGTLPLSADTRDLVPLLRHLTESFSSLAERRGIVFTVAWPVGGLRVRYDADQMEKVITNLVSNALKFTPSGGNVWLRASADVDGKVVVIEVEDSGPGIAQELHARVFERFFQVDDSTRRSHEGLGIGLALVRELVELHGGTVALRSVPGAGSTFTVRLPLSSAPVSQESAAAKPVVVGRYAPPEHARAPDGALTILVVEDNTELLEFLRGHLAARFRVLVAENGAQGLAMAREHVPDLIISDVMMPEMDGQELCERLKGDREIDFIPVILLTAKAGRDSRLLGLAAGADDYLAKPVDIPELLVRIDNLITARRRVRERHSAVNRELPSITLPVANPPRDASARTLVANFGAVIAEHLADDAFDIEAMAVAMGMGRSTLYRKLTPILGRSPMESLLEYRLAQGAQWLTETEVTVSEVAYGVGFKSVPHFCLKFRERYNQTPTDYRRASASAT